MKKFQCKYTSVQGTLVLHLQTRLQWHQRFVPRRWFQQSQHRPFQPARQLCQQCNKSTSSVECATGVQPVSNVVFVVTVQIFSILRIAAKVANEVKQCQTPLPRAEQLILLELLLQFLADEEHHHRASPKPLLNLVPRGLDPPRHLQLFLRWLPATGRDRTISTSAVPSAALQWKSSSINSHSWPRFTPK